MLFKGRNSAETTRGIERQQYSSELCSKSKAKRDGEGKTAIERSHIGNFASIGGVLERRRVNFSSSDFGKVAQLVAIRCTLLPLCAKRTEWIGLCVMKRRGG